MLVCLLVTPAPSLAFLYPSYQESIGWLICHLWSVSGSREKDKLQPLPSVQPRVAHGVSSWVQMDIFEGTVRWVTHTGMGGQVGLKPLSMVEISVSYHQTKGIPRLSWPSWHWKLCGLRFPITPAPTQTMQEFCNM